jgi:hypothetical protein
LPEQEPISSGNTGASVVVYIPRKKAQCSIHLYYLSISPAAFWEYCPELLQCLSAKVPLGML